MKNIINKIQGHEVLEHSIAHYKPNTKTIHIFNGIFKPTLKNEQFQTSYAKLTASVSNNNFIVNLFVLHEIGHAIYNNILEDKDYNTNYGNFTDYFKIDSNNKLHKEHNTILHENFADMFAAIAYLTIDKNNPDLINDLELFSQFRKELKKNKYYTFNSLDKIINDYKTNNLNFSDNSQILRLCHLIVLFPSTKRVAARWPKPTPRLALRGTPRFYQHKQVTEPNLLSYIFNLIEYFLH